MSPGNPAREDSVYLKSLELIGFKSFADRTVLEFGEGITAIVGPNGCGKSNMSDAIRWVLGEQSVRLLRGTKMEDCIFNGTDNRKPLNLAEVSLTFTGCEGVLGTDFHEVTVTRRVFRTGEGQYFINKTACRLKDIQRLFMETGIGTNSYSLMEQGRIDVILRSRPDDRREVFEEASGITKFKADKREALRKLEQTENNLLRLADIVKEVKRQIISLQRQAGKAARYQKYHDELRRLDIYASRQRLKVMAADLQALEDALGARRAAVAAAQAAIEALDQENAAARAALADLDQAHAAERQASTEQQSRLERTRQTLEHGRQRLAELQDLIRRDTGDGEAAAREAQGDRQALERHARDARDAGALLTAAETALQSATAASQAHEQTLEAAQSEIRALLAETLELDDRHARLQNELHQLDNEDRAIVSRRERCAAEQTTLRVTLAAHEQRRAEALQVRGRLAGEAADAEAELERRLAARAALDAERGARAARLADRRSRLAAVAAQRALLDRSLDEQEAFSEPVRRLLRDPSAFGASPAQVLGALADHVRAAPDARLALEAVLRLWQDAVVVSDDAAARDLLRRLQAEPQGAARLLAVSIPGAAAPPAPAAGPGVPLAGQVTCDDALRPLLDRLLAGVWLVETLDDFPETLPAGTLLVTRGGALARGPGAYDLARDERHAANPLARRRQADDLRQAADRLQAETAAEEQAAADDQARYETQDAAIRQARETRDERRAALARHEGEQALVDRQAEQARGHLDTVTWELRDLEAKGDTAARKSALIAAMDQLRARRAEIKHAVERRQREAAALEAEHKQFQSDVVAATVRAAQHRQRVEHLVGLRQPLEARIAQADAVARERAARVGAHQAALADLQRATGAAAAELPEIERALADHAARVASLQVERQDRSAACRALEERLKQQRQDLDRAHETLNAVTANSTEARLKRDHLLERVTGEYRLAPEALASEPEPAWPDGTPPPPETLDGQIAELRARLEAMGPVNTGAIDEYQELQERFAFLTHQQDDLVKAKQQLMDLIRRINQTTTDLFSATFAKINENFQSMFQQLFGGGSAKLILTDEEDILECGIEIFARPPGKRLQSISLLSGGESTMAAVALLFAIYMVKPSPFCLLDEMDAALDDSNIHRFVKVVRGFLNQSQFLVITHNRQTIGAASTLYGVTMEADKVSRIVSMRFREPSDRRAADAPTAPAAVTPAPAPVPALAAAPAEAGGADAAVRAETAAPPQRPA